MLTTEEFESLGLTCAVAAAAVALTLPLGIAVAWVLARCEFFGKTLVETLVNLPLVMPPVATGYLLLMALGREGVIGGWLERSFGIRCVFDFNGAVIAAAVMAFPLMVRPIRLGFAAVDRRLELAARSLGAGRVDVFRSITLPLAARGIVAGSILAFARSLGEFGATMILAGNIPGETRTVSLYLYGLLETPGGAARAPWIVLWCVALAAAALLIGEYLDQRSRRILRSQ